ncbi:MAG: hypothetical protein FWD52_08195 [Candidatus Bathyarchaeota archaeon]|nr:hypothetical protein [Candidatus Termiticorpusculum sp.]
MSNILQVAYIVFTLLGVVSYNLTGYYAKRREKKIAMEKAKIDVADSKTETSYSYTKLARTVMTGGFASLIATVVAYSAQSFEPQYLILSFVNGAIFCAGIDKLEDIGKK